MNKDQIDAVTDAIQKNKTEARRSARGAVPTNGARNREWRLAYLMAAVGFACTGCIAFFTANDSSFGALLSAGEDFRMNEKPNAKWHYSIWCGVAYGQIPVGAVIAVVVYFIFQSLRTG